MITVTEWRPKAETKLALLIDNVKWLSICSNYPTDNIISDHIKQANLHCIHYVVTSSANYWYNFDLFEISS